VWRHEIPRAAQLAGSVGATGTGEDTITADLHDIGTPGGQKMSRWQ